MCQACWQWLVYLYISLLTVDGQFLRAKGKGPFALTHQHWEVSGYWLVCKLSSPPPASPHSSRVVWAEESPSQVGLRKIIGGGLDLHGEVF